MEVATTMSHGVGTGGPYVPPVLSVPSHTCSFSSRSPGWHQGCAILCQQRGGVLAAPSKAQRHHPQVHHLLLQPRLRATGKGTAMGTGWGWELGSYGASGWRQK